jgi:AcrR family transcriptional regulator
LSVDAIVEAAVGLADAEGLEAVSMARVANDLGFTTMSLYRYVSSKDELLQLMWNASAQGAEKLVLAGDDWRQRLRAWAMVQRGGLDRHPWITQMPMAAPPLAPNSLTFVERGLETLDDTGISEADKPLELPQKPNQPRTRHRYPNGASRGFSANSSTNTAIRGSIASPGPTRSAAPLPGTTSRRNMLSVSSGSLMASKY